VLVYGSTMALQEVKQRVTLVLQFILFAKQLENETVTKQNITQA